MLARLRQVRADDDCGWAMVTVMGLMTTMMVLVAVALQLAVGSIGTARGNQDFHGAVAAAQAGVSDFVYRLNADNTYYRFDAANPDTSTSGNAAFTGWVDIPGTSSAYSYTVPAGQSVEQTGQVQLDVTGRVGAQERTVTVTLGRKSFLDYLYFTKFETTDPLASYDADTDPANDATRQSECGRPFDQRPSICSLVPFSTGDRMRGPVYSADKMYMTGTPVFEDVVETGWNVAPHWAEYTGPGAQGTPNPSLMFEGGPPLHGTAELPSTNASLRDAAQATGCVYTGPTRIIFKPNGTMDVTSPWTTTVNACGSFNSTNGYTTVGLPVKPNSAIWVQRSPGTTSCTLDQQRDRVGFPIRYTSGGTVYEDNTLLGGASPLFYDCHNADVFVEGWVKGRLTLGADNNVVVTGSLRYVGAGDSAVSTAPGEVDADVTGSDVLGLLANRFVAVYHPLLCTTRDTETSLCTAGDNLSRTPPTSALRPTAYPLTDVQIDAAIVAPSNSFLVQSNKSGPQLGTLTVLGAIVQQYRGAVAGVSGGLPRGYAKNYHYDERLRYAPPPFLGDLARTSWGVRQFVE